MAYLAELVLALVAIGGLAGVAAAVVLDRPTAGFASACVFVLAAWALWLRDEKGDQ